MQYSLLRDLRSRYASLSLPSSRPANIGGESSLSPPSSNPFCGHPFGYERLCILLLLWGKVIFPQGAEVNSYVDRIPAYELS